MSNSARNVKNSFFLPIMAVFGGSGGTASFLKLCKIYVKRRLFNFLTHILRFKPSLITTDYMKVAKLPPPPQTHLYR